MCDEINSNLKKRKKKRIFSPFLTFVAPYWNPRLGVLLVPHGFNVERLTLNKIKIFFLILKIHHMWDWKLTQDSEQCFKVIRQVKTCCLKYICFHLKYTFCPLKTKTTNFVELIFSLSISSNMTKWDFSEDVFSDASRQISIIVLRWTQTSFNLYHPVHGSIAPWCSDHSKKTFFLRFWKQLI